MTRDPLDDGGPPQWVWRWLTGVALFLAVTVVVVGVVIGLTALDRQSRIQEASARSDCRAAINAPIGEITRKAQIQSAKTTQLFNAALLASQAGLRPTAEQVAEFLRENNKLTADLARAARLPDDPNVIVEHGGVIDGKRFAPCPRVG